MNRNMVILEFLLFPGLLFTALAGLLTSWVDRKVTALVQMRVGPPFLQPFYDIRKLLIKETCVPADGAIGLFLLAPLLGLAAVTLASMILWRTLMNAEATFVGDLIVLIYLLTMPALGVILGAFGAFFPPRPLLDTVRPALAEGHEHEFVLVWFIHTGLYLGAVVGVIVAASRIWRARRARSARAPAACGHG